MTKPVNQRALVAAMVTAGALFAACADNPEPASPAPAPAPPPVVTAVVAEPPPAPTAVASAAPAAPAVPKDQGRCQAGMAEVPGGTFKSSYYRKESKVDPFCVDVSLTTTDEYTACVQKGGCDKNQLTVCDPSTFGVADRGKLPMICVDFNQAEKYCKAQNKRLVTDTEWEWAARGGEEARTFPWGNEPPGDQVCWSGKEKRKTPCAVGAFPAGPHGLLDMAGNIYEWTTTTNDASSTFRGGRGGAWKDKTVDEMKITHRGGFKATYRCGFLGIRCATPVPASQ